MEKLICLGWAKSVRFAREGQGTVIETLIHLIGKG